MKDARDTDAGLASGLRVGIMRISRRLRNEREEDVDLSVSGLSVLGVLFRDGPASAGTLAAHERVRPPSMTRTVNCLVERGYAVRRASNTDGRSILVDISQMGREVLLADRHRRTAWLARQLKDLSREEREILRRAVPILERIATS